LFKSKFPNVQNVYGNLGFGLSGGGELISLYNNYGRLVDSLTYKDKEPWTSICDGGGPTLELINPYLDNSNYSNWNSSSNFGTPGEVNSVFTSVKNNTQNYPNTFKLFQNYPNPFNPSTIIKYSIPLNVNNKSSIVSLKVFDILGREVETLVNKEQKPGNYEFQFNGAQLTSGAYFYKIQSGNIIIVKKMILIR